MAGFSVARLTTATTVAMATSRCVGPNSNGTPAHFPGPLKPWLLPVGVLDPDILKN